VLVVDDANGLVEIYQRWLVDEFRVLTATDGQEAIATADDTVDVVLIDRDLSKMSGSTVVEEIRKPGHDPSVVLLSSVEPDLEVIGIEFETCLTKPVMRRDLVAEVERAAGGTPGDRSDGSSGSELEDATFDLETDDPEPTDSTTRGSEDRTEASDSSGPDSGDDVESDVTDRLQSLQADLEETADELSSRIREGSTEDDDPEGETAGSGGRDDADRGVDREQTGAGSDWDDRPGREREAGDRERPRDVLPDEDETRGGPDESLQERVERLASKATDLAETPVEDERDEASNDATDG